VLLETGWIRLRGRRRTPGRPVTYGITDEFLVHFGLESMDDLPGIDELKAAGLLETQAPGGDGLPRPGESLPGRDEDPLEEGDDGSDFRPPVGDDVASEGKSE
jgi:segregation and condensation protein B